MYDPAVLDITPDIILEKFMAGVGNLVSLSLGCGYTTVASVPHILVNGFKDLLAISVVTDYTFTESEKVILICISVLSPSSCLLECSYWCGLEIGFPLRWRLPLICTGNNT